MDIRLPGRLLAPPGLPVRLLHHGNPAGVRHLCHDDGQGQGYQEVLDQLQRQVLRLAAGGWQG